MAPATPPEGLDRRHWLRLSALSAAWLMGCGGGDSTPDTAPAPPTSSPSPAVSPSPATATYANFSGASLGDLANTNRALAFPDAHAWNTDISQAPVDPNSSALLNSIGLSNTLRPDFGASLWNGGTIGIPYTIVSGSQTPVAVRFTVSGAESEPGPYPVPSTAPVEGGNASTGDRHVIVIDRDNNRLYELYNAARQADNSWTADSGAVFRLDSLTPRPTAQAGWTSADAAGLPIFPGLVRYEEAARGPGGILHALRFTAPRTRAAYVPPANHSTGSNTATNLPPMGMRVRLKASFAIPASFSAESRAILTALKTYGMLLADNGSSWYLSGAPDARWNDSLLLSELGQVKGSDFEVVRMDGLVVTVP